MAGQSIYDSIKSCPFCPGSWHTVDLFEGNKHLMAIRCSKCYNSTNWYEYIEDAIEEWNGRY